MSLNRRSFFGLGAKAAVAGAVVATVGAKRVEAPEAKAPEPEPFSGYKHSLLLAQQGAIGACCSVTHTSVYNLVASTSTRQIQIEGLDEMDAPVASWLRFNRGGGRT